MDEEPVAPGARGRHAARDPPAPPQLGYPSPTSSWLLRDDNWRAARELLLDPRTLGRGILDGSRVERALRSYVRGPALYRAHRTGRIWTWLTLELWFRQFID